MANVEECLSKGHGSRPVELTVGLVIVQRLDATTIPKWYLSSHGKSRNLGSLIYVGTLSVSSSYLVSNIFTKE